MGGRLATFARQPPHLLLALKKVAAHKPKNEIKTTEV
jgi:hypothetical protein